MPTAYSYVRFSRDKQSQGDSTRRQTEGARKWTERQVPPIPLDDSLDLRDLGVSAYRGKNSTKGKLTRFLEAIETGRVKPGDYLILENLDRLSRGEVLSVALPLVQGMVEAGVRIVTLSPEAVYDKTSLQEIGSLFGLLTALWLANEESRKKSARLIAAWQQKRRKATDIKLSRIAPFWLNLSDDRKQFELLPERIAVVRRVYDLAASGLGCVAICKRLNAEGADTFGKPKRKARQWNRSSVLKLLRNRAVLGEYQPHRMENGNRVPAGEPIADYFPAVVDEATFYAAQRHGAQPSGRHGKRLTNLFTGLLKDARDGSNLVIVDKGSGPALVSSAARDKYKGATYLSLPYSLFENSLLVWAYDLPLGDVVPTKARNVDVAIGKAEGRLAELQQRIGKLKRRLATDDIDAAMDVLIELERERKETTAKLERLKQEQATPESDALTGLKRLVAALKAATGDDLYFLRCKLRSTLRRLVEDVVVLTIQVNNERVAVADVQLKNGQRRRVKISTKPMDWPEGMAEKDVRQWAKWPKELKQTRFTVLTTEARQMIAMDAKGAARTAIAEKLGCSLSQVSRTLVRLGKRKRDRKSRDSKWLMTWHPAGNGWVKRHNHRRYYIGLGELKRQYPRRVTDRTAEGSWRAANAWWEATLKGLAPK